MSIFKKPSKIFVQLSSTWLLLPYLQGFLRSSNTFCEYYTSINGQQKIALAITAVKSMVLRKANINLTKRTGKFTEDEVEYTTTIMQNLCQYKIPVWFLNKQKDMKDGQYSQALASGLDNKLYEDLEQLKKFQVHRELHHF